MREKREKNKDKLFGWNMRETNLTTGALLGYSSENWRVTLKVPPSHGVSSGPKMTPCQLRMSSSSGVAQMPAGGSVTKRLKSRISLLRAGVVMLLCLNDGKRQRKNEKKKKKTVNQSVAKKERGKQEKVVLLTTRQKRKKGRKRCLPEGRRQVLWVGRLCVILDDAREAREDGLVVPEVLQWDALCAALVNNTPTAPAVMLLLKKKRQEQKAVKQKAKTSTTTS